MTEIEVEKIESNWKKYEKILGRISCDGISNLLESMGERIVMCPLSRSSNEPGAYPGGLIEHSLGVASTMKKLNDSLEMGLPMESILKVSLLHDIGRVGDEENDLLIPQDSDWHREKLGQNYKYNENLSRMSVTHRTLYLLQRFGISLTREEWVAIQISGGSHFEENRFYVGFEPSLGILLQKSKSLVMHRSS